MSFSCLHGNERYAMSVARWIQCEEAVTEYGGAAPQDDVMERLLQTRKGKS